MTTTGNPVINMAASSHRSTWRRRCCRPRPPTATTRLLLTNVQRVGEGCSPAGHRNLRPSYRNMHPYRCYHSQQERQCPCEGGQQHDQHHNAGGIPNGPPDQAHQGLRIIRSDLGRFLRPISSGDLPQLLEGNLPTSLYPGHVAALFLCVETWRTRRRVASLLAQGGRSRVQEGCSVDTTRLRLEPIRPTNVQLGHPMCSSDAAPCAVSDVLSCAHFALRNFMCHFASCLVATLVVARIGYSRCIPLYLTLEQAKQASCIPLYLTLEHVVDQWCV
jgi:hypothetical protein